MEIWGKVFHIWDEGVGIWFGWGFFCGCDKNGDGRFRKIWVVCGWSSLTKNAEKRRISAEFTPQVQFEISENAYFAKFDIQSESAILISPKRKECFGIHHTAHGACAHSA